MVQGSVPGSSSFGVSVLPTYKARNSECQMLSGWTVSLIFWGQRFRFTVSDLGFRVSEGWQEAQNP